MKIRKGNIVDLEKVRALAVATWSKYQSDLTSEHWSAMQKSLTDEKLYRELLTNAASFICENENGEVIGMSFLVVSGNPTEIYNEEQCYIRFVTVADAYGGLKLGQQLTMACVDLARENGETKIALHTSEFMDKARHIYEKMGFRVIKEIPLRYGKKYWLYEMDL